MREGRSMLKASEYRAPPRKMEKSGQVSKYLQRRAKGHKGRSRCQASDAIGRGNTCH
jgi:hypothetical protein